MGSIMMVVLLVLASMVNLTEGAGATYGKVWNYLTEGPQAKGPSTWKNGQGNEICGHQSQSPINIHSGDAHPQPDLGVLELHSYDDTTNTTFVMKNRDTDVEFKAKSSSGDPKHIPQRVSWNGTVYRLYQLHFHWGKDTHQGSEHQLDSQQYAAEMHIIHYNDNYPNVSAALAQSDGLLVWGHFLQVTSETRVVNSYVKNIIKDFDDVRNSGQHKDVKVNLKKLLPEKHDTYFHYRGSLTTPPCFESVAWIVNNNPIRVSEQMMKDEFRSLIDGPMSTLLNTTHQMGDNYRPVQPLNGRTVYANFDPMDTTCASVATGISISFIGMVINVLMALFLMM